MVWFGLVCFGWMEKGGFVGFLGWRIMVKFGYLFIHPFTNERTNERGINSRSDYKAGEGVVNDVSYIYVCVMVMILE